MDVFKIKKGELNFLLTKFTKIGIFHFTFMERFNSNTSVWLVAECGMTIAEYLIGDDILMKAQNGHSVTVLVEFLLEREICLVLLALPLEDFLAVEPCQSSNLTSLGSRAFLPSQYWIRCPFYVLPDSPMAIPILSICDNVS